MKQLSQYYKKLLKGAIKRAYHDSDTWTEARLIDIVDNIVGIRGLE